MISVLMPAYNAGKYIAEAIESVKSQTYKDWELIIVDDKSTDDTYDIILKHAQCDNRIKVYQLENNSGSAQRPRLEAEKMANGEFISFLDADDVLDSKYLGELLHRQIDTHADAVVSRLCYMTLDGMKGNPINPTKSINLNSIISGKEAFMLTVGSWQINGLGLFKKEVLDRASRKANLLIDSINADELYTRIKFLSCDNVAFCQTDYYYRINQESITRKFSLKLFDSLDAVDNVRLLTLNTFGNDSKEYAQAVSYFFKTILNCISLFRRRIKDIDLDKRLVIKQKIISNWEKISYKDVYRSSFKEGLIFSMGFYPVYMIYILRNYVRIR